MGKENTERFTCFAVKNGEMEVKEWRLPIVL
jgi:hypothetical protein